MPTYTVLSVNAQTDDATPVLLVEATGTDAVPTAVRPFDPTDEKQVVLASRLLDSITSHPDDNTLARIAVSYGGLRDASGKEF